MAWDGRSKVCRIPQVCPTGSFSTVPPSSYADRTGEPVDRVIRHVLIHEIGHHFGFSDAGMTLIESGA